MDKTASSAPVCTSYRPQHPDQAFQDSLSRYLAKYKSRLTRDEEKELENTKLSDVKRQILQIQDQQGKERKAINLTRMDKFIKAMDEWENVVSIFADSTVFVAFVWGLVKALLRAASTFSDSFENLLDAYEQLGLRLPSLEPYRELFAENAEMRNALGLMYSDIAEFHLKALRFFSGSGWKKSFTSLWKDFGTKFGGTLRALDQHRSLIEELARQYQFNQYQLDRKQLFEVVQSYENLREKLMADIDSRVEQEHSRKLDDTQALLNAASPHSEHERACRRRGYDQHSGRWLLEKAQIKSWKDDEIPESSALWLNGMPGAGKTVLASLMVEECRKQIRSKVLYFYCVEKDSTKNTYISVAKSLISQAIGESSEVLLPHCYDRLKKHAAKISQSNTDAATLLEFVLQRATQQEEILDQQSISTRYYVVIDGLDECESDEWQRIVESMRQLIQSLEKTHYYGRLRVLLVSQHTNQIESALKGVASLSIIPGDNADDIKGYAEQRVNAIQQKFNLKDEERAGIVAETCDGAHGMFLYARLVMDNLLNQRTKILFYEELAQKFPKGLAEAYERILTRIRRDSSAKLGLGGWEEIRTLLGWLVCARRLLTWQEIQCACSIDPDKSTIDFEGRQLRNHIRDDCGSLIEASSDQFVRLVHGTTSRYLVVTGFVNELVAETSLTTKCFQYLVLPCFTQGLSPQGVLHVALLGHYIFQDYAVGKWSGHFTELLRKATAAKEQEHGLPSTYRAELSNQALLDDALAQFRDALDNFTKTYQDAFTDTSEEQVTLGAWNQLAFKEDTEDFHMSLCAIQAHIQQHLRKAFEIRNKISIEALATAFDRNRSFLEDPAQDPFKIKLKAHEEKTLKDTYGEQRYKCPRLDCDSFYMGNMWIGTNVHSVATCQNVLESSALHPAMICRSIKERLTRTQVRE
ncbi:hypothetical protein A1O7_02446 [Cladophialophora yegresii CBS 114405]|uniref:Uncharacterized protein n=1 Tax=Cladophialophora yegresii CBS 114405 TaxID=1182544 RepID=W9WUN0_9EURO|nr:uncharacterized protein A1O7_02446 [Cladophialophora yegresii CBS 114405]EXJ62014.1 hypothetical protein A1O7_02446 [Cladophialophora yegresii CBS 114405]